MRLEADYWCDALLRGAIKLERVAPEEFAEASFAAV